MQKIQIQSLSQEVSLETGTVTHSSILAWRIPRTEGPGGLQFIRLQRLDTTEWLTLSLFLLYPLVYKLENDREFMLFIFVYFLHQKSYLENKSFLLLRWINEWLIDLIYVTTSVFIHPSFSQSRPSCWLHSNKALKSSSQLLFSASGTHWQKGSQLQAFKKNAEVKSLLNLSCLC